MTGKRLCLMTGLAVLSLSFAVSAQTGPTQKELNDAARSKANWLHPNHDYAGMRFVDAKQITTANVASLHPVCMYQSKERVPAQSSPLVYNDVLYFTTTHYTIAIDATDCRLRWEHVWQPRSKGSLSPKSRRRDERRQNCSWHLRWISPCARLSNRRSHVEPADCRFEARTFLQHAPADLRRFSRHRSRRRRMGCERMGRRISPLRMARRSGNSTQFPILASPVPKRGEKIPKSWRMAAATSGHLSHSTQSAARFTCQSEIPLPISTTKRGQARISTQAPSSRSIFTPEK